MSEQLRNQRALARRDDVYRWRKWIYRIWKELTEPMRLCDVRDHENVTAHSWAHRQAWNKWMKEKCGLEYPGAGINDRIWQASKVLRHVAKCMTISWIPCHSCRNGQSWIVRGQSLWSEKSQTIHAPIVRLIEILLAFSGVPPDGRSGCPANPSDKRQQGFFVNGWIIPQEMTIPCNAACLLDSLLGYLEQSQNLKFSTW